MKDKVTITVKKAWYYWQLQPVIVENCEPKFKEKLPEKVLPVVTSITNSAKRNCRFPAGKDILISLIFRFFSKQFISGLLSLLLV